MKLKYVYKVIVDVMTILQDIDCNDIYARKINQTKVNKAYNKLDTFKDEIIREFIKLKQNKIKGEG